MTSPKPRYLIESFDAPAPLLAHIHRGDSTTLNVVFLSIGVKGENGGQPPEFVKSAIGPEMDHVLFIADTSLSWLNTKGLADDVVRLIDDYRDANEIERTNLIGFSMGGFMACVLAARLKANVVIAFAPQFSIDRRFAPGERRWRPMLRRIEKWRQPTIEPMDSPETDFIVLHGDAALEEIHSSKIPLRPNIAHYVLGDTTHNVPASLKRKGVLTSVIRAGVAGRIRLVRRILSQHFEVTQRLLSDKALAQAITDRRSGACLCGSITVSADIGPRKVVACHCGQCRRWTGGGPYFSTSVESPTIEGEVAIYAASEWGERGFCPKCGTTVFWKMKGGPVRNLAAGLFDDQSGFAVTEEIFCDRRASWHSDWPAAVQSTEAQEFAKFDASLEGDDP